MKKIMMIIVIICLIFILLRLQILPQIYPRKYSEYVEKYAQEHKIDSLLIYSIVKAESNFDINAKSSSGAIGLMQVMLSTAEEIGKSLGIEKITEEELYRPEINIEIGVKYFKILLEKYNNYNLAIIAYNAGMGNLDTWLDKGIIDKQGKNIEDIPFPETRNYVRKILHNYKIYQEIY